MCRLKCTEVHTSVLVLPTLVFQTQSKRKQNSTNQKKLKIEKFNNLNYPLSSRLRTLCGRYCSALSVHEDSAQKILHWLQRDSLIVIYHYLTFLAGESRLVATIEAERTSWYETSQCGTSQCGTFGKQIESLNRCSIVMINRRFLLGNYLKLFDFVGMILEWLLEWFLSSAATAF